MNVIAAETAPRSHPHYPILVRNSVASPVLLHPPGRRPKFPRAWEVPKPEVGIALSISIVEGHWPNHLELRDYRYAVVIYSSYHLLVTSY